jgi:regulator of protease activity HflC (stomatin/prohibitin superfamily)
MKETVAISEIRPAARPLVRWGRVSAKPSEYLVKIRRGRIVQHGPGLSVFIWPWDTYTIIPTSIQQATFVADQITAEKVGVAVTGIAVYRVADPLLAFRMLDFSSDGQGVEVLASTLQQMFVGAARRLVARMTVEDCLTHRKESIAHELMNEIQPVVSGMGRPDDITVKGWGVVIDTIEIQDVRILSETVFRNLQAPFRAELSLRARSCEVEQAREVHLKEVEAQQTMLEVDKELGRRRAEADEQKALATLASDQRIALVDISNKEATAEAKLRSDLAGWDRSRQIADADYTSRVHVGQQEGELERLGAQHEIEIEHQRVQGQAQLARQRAEQAADLAQWQASAEAELSRLKVRSKAEVDRAEAEARLSIEELETETALRVARQRTEIERVQGELAAFLKQQAKQVDNLFTDERIRYEFVAHTLPAIAQAFVESMGDVNVTQISSSGEGKGSGVAFLAESLAQILSVARTAGFDPARLMGPQQG